MEQHIVRLNCRDKEIILIGTAHISKRNAEQVKEIIEAEKPDTVCVELDYQRYLALTRGAPSDPPDLRRLIRRKKAPYALLSVLLGKMQKRLAADLNTVPGQEMLQAIQSAEAVGAELVLADRDIRITLRRTWDSLSFFEKIKLLFQTAFGMRRTEITEAKLEEMQSPDSLTVLLNQFAAQYPRLKQPLIDERDQYIARRIITAPGEKIAAVVGAAHIPGITKNLKDELI